jgi:hypothetical protein
MNNVMLYDSGRKDWNRGSSDGDRWRSMVDGVDRQISRSSSYSSASIREIADCTYVDDIPQTVLCASLHIRPVEPPDLMTII